MTSLNLVGQTLGGYAVLEQIGVGGMGAVFKARQPVLDRIVALKVIAPQVAQDAAYIARFQHEAKAAARLNHPNVVAVYSAGEDQGVHFLVEEFVEGESLHDRLTREGRMDPQEALAICVFVAEGLKHAWDEAHIIHRDIKPANILLSAKGSVKVGDLGLAKSVGPEASAALTQSGTTVGTPFYMSPEQAQAEKELDFRADIYSLGCTLFHMLSGRKPYENGADQSPMSVIIKQATAPPPMILQVLPGCPGPVVTLLAKMLAKQPGARHASYDELISDLRRVHDLLGQPKASAPVSSALQAAGKAKKKPAAALIYGAAAVAAVVVVAGLLLWAPWRSGKDEQGRREDAKAEAEAKPGSESRLQAESAPPAPAKAGTPNLEAQATPPAKTEVAKVEPKPSVPVATPSPSAGKMPALPAAPPPIQNLKSKIQNRVDEAWIASLAALAPEDQVARVMDKMALLNPKFDGKQTHKVEGGKVVELSFSSAEVSDLSPLKALKDLQSLNCGGAGQKRTLRDLSPLRGLKLTKLAIPFTAVSDLSPLAGMPLASLQISSTRVGDLAPLKGAPLAWLSCVDAPVKDLAPLAGMPLATLWIRGTEASDLSPLRGMALKELDCDTAVASAEANKAVLFAMKSLETIAGQPAAEFWKAVGAPEDPWFKQVAALPAGQQVPAVMAKLKELNPGFDDRETHKIENVGGASAPRPSTRTGALQAPPSDAAVENRRSLEPSSAVTELAFSTVAVTNIAPVKVLTDLKKLTLLPWAVGRARPPGALADLSPLAGLPLTFLACGNTQVSDLTPLKGMPLTILSVDNTAVSDLSPLAGMPLTILWCDKTKVADLSPLAGMPLVELKCDAAVAAQHAALLRGMKTLAKINDMTAAMFWTKTPGSAGILPASGRAPSTPTAAGKMPALPGPATPLTPATTGVARTGQPFVTSIGMEMAYIPPGEFLMGSTPEERAWANANGCDPKYTAYEGEAPRKTAVKQGFWLGKTEVTVGQWKLFVAATGCVTDGEKKGESHAPIPGKPWGLVKGASWKDPNFGFKLKDNDAVSCISWNDAVAFCAWLNEREQKSGRLPPGYKVRLPTEAEWEYACRAGKQTKFWWGETKEGGDNRLNWSGKGDGFEFVSPVDHYGSRGRNKFGLADMLGNVWEWCLDEFDEKQAHEEPFKGNPGARVLRGGSFTGNPGHCRSAGRRSPTPSTSHGHGGFRVSVGVER
jgi:formylglycine-generating enzyme required for sulfatase activity/tRNA A-37 threonylcarbamoyl transferase component Bud32